MPQQNERLDQMPDTKKRGRAPQMQPQERRQQLLDAGVACVALKGIGATKHADLARSCEVSVPAVFTYFPNREDLVNSILEEVGRKLFEEVIAPCQALPEPQERLGRTATLFAEYTLREPDHVKVWLMWSMHFSPEIRARYQKFEAKIVDALGEMITDGTGQPESSDDIQDRARMIVASSAFLAKMVIDGVSQERRNAFVKHVLSPLAVS